jgi:hypothetical protein
LDKAVTETGILRDRPYRFRDAIDKMLTNVERYVNASKAKKESLRFTDDDTTGVSDADDARREVETPSVFKQSFSEHELVPNVRSGERSEEVSNDGTLDGIGSGSDDASSVRSDQDMATDTRTEPVDARKGRRVPHIRR